MNIEEITLVKIPGFPGRRKIRVVVSTSKGNVILKGETDDVEAELANLGEWVASSEDEFLLQFAGARQLTLPLSEKKE